MGMSRIRPILRRIEIPNPAVGVDWSFRNNLGGLLLLRTLTYVLVTDANVANRVPTVQVRDGAVTWFAVSSVTPATATTTTRFMHIDSGGEFGAIGAVRGMPWPGGGLLVEGGATLEVVTTAIQVGDQYSAIVATAVEYPEGLPVNWVPLPSMYLDTEMDGNDG